MWSLLSSLIQADVEASVSRRIRGLGHVAIVVLFLLTAYVAAVISLALFLAGLIAPWMASASMALGFVVAAGLVWFVMVLRARAEERQAAALAHARQDATKDVLSSLAGSEGPNRQLVMIAALAGVLLSSLVGKGSGERDDD